jgi:hypothetical protein
MKSATGLDSGGAFHFVLGDTSSIFNIIAVRQKLHNHQA